MDDYVIPHRTQPGALSLPDEAASVKPFAELGSAPEPMMPDEFARFVRRQVATHQKIVKLADIEPL